MYRPLVCYNFESSVNLWLGVQFLHLLFYIKNLVNFTKSYQAHWTLDVSRPSPSFLKIGLLVFSDIVHQDSWPWYLVTDIARFLKKKIWRSKLVSNVPKLDQRLGFLSFFQVWFISFPGNCIVEVKPKEKNWRIPNWGRN